MRQSRSCEHVRPQREREREDLAGRVNEAEGRKKEKDGVPVRAGGETAQFPSNSARCLSLDLSEMRRTQKQPSGAPSSPFFSLFPSSYSPLSDRELPLREVRMSDTPEQKREERFFFLSSMEGRRLRGGGRRGLGGHQWLFATLPLCHA